jgi:hypothetical protein
LQLNFLYSTNDDELLNATRHRGPREIHYYVKFARAFPPALYNDYYRYLQVTE